MPKLPALKSRDVVRALEKIGFRFERQKGGHRIYKKDRAGITILWHSGDLKKGTLRKIITQSGVTVEEFLKLL